MLASIDRIAMALPHWAPEVQVLLVDLVYYFLSYISEGDEEHHDVINDYLAKILFSKHQKVNWRNFLEKEVHLYTNGC